VLLGIVLLALLAILSYHWRPETTEVPAYTRTLRWCEIGKLLSIAQPMTFVGYMFLPVAVVMLLNGIQVSLVDWLLAPYSFYLYYPSNLHAFYIQQFFEVHLPTCLLPLFFALLVHSKISSHLSRNEPPSRKTFLLVSAAGLIALTYLVAVLSRYLTFAFGEYYWKHVILYCVVPFRSFRTRCSSSWNGIQILPVRARASFQAWLDTFSRNKIHTNACHGLSDMS